MLLMTSNTRSGGGSQGRASFARRVSGRSEAKSLDGRRSGGYSASDARPCLFNTFTYSNRHVYAPEPRTHRFASNCLISFTFTHSNL
jgi:hypothetical protein